MPTCKKCGGHFPNLIKIDGLTKNLCNRKYCLTCSPRGSHNTKKLHVVRDLQTWMSTPCSKCGLPYSDRKRSPGESICWVCRNKIREKKQSDAIFEIVGESCWMCGYENGKSSRKLLHLHHVKKKAFSLSRRGCYSHDIKEILLELRKCMLVCPNCHGEIHLGLHSKEDVVRVYNQEWEKRATGTIG